MTSLIFRDVLLSQDLGQNWKQPRFWAAEGGGGKGRAGRIEGVGSRLWGWPIPVDYFQNSHLL